MFSATETDDLSAANIAAAGNTQFWQYYHLKQDPFLALPRNVTPFMPNEWREQINFTLHQCQYTQALISVTGELGGGKTVFKNLLCGELTPQTRLFQLPANSAINISKLVGILAKGFQIPRQTFVNLSDSEQLSQQLQFINQQNHHYLLIFDDAQQLPDATLESLFDLITQQKVERFRLHILLLGLPELKTRLEKIATQKNIASFLSHCKLAAFSAKTTEKYLRYRFYSAGLNGKMPFSAAMLTQIQKKSEGNPTQIHTFARLLLQSKMVNKSYFLPEVLHRHRLKLVTLGVIVAFILLFTLIDEQPEMLPQNRYAISAMNMLEKKSKQLENKKQTKPTILATTNNVTKKPIKIVKSKPVQIAKAPSSNADAFVANVKAEQAAQPFLQASPKVVIKPSKPTVLAQTTQPIKQTTKPTVVKSSASSSTTQAPVTTNSNNNQQGEFGDTFVGEQLPKYTLNETETRSILVSPSDNTSIPQATVAKPTHKSKPKIALPVSTVHKMTGPQYQPLVTHKTLSKTNGLSKQVKSNQAKIMLMSKNTYTLQLSGSYHEQAIKDFIQFHHLEGKATYFHTYYQGKDWYVAIMGRFPSVEAAHAAIDNLPLSLRQAKPWTRSYASVQNAISTLAG